ncbi:MAG: flagellar motor switch protein FliN [Pseudomonadota bacterium]
MDSNNDVQNSEDDISADDWAAALAEQASSPQDSTPVASPRFEDFGGAAASSSGPIRVGGEEYSSQNLELVLDVPVRLTVELGHTRIPIRNLLQLGQGSVVELNEMAGEPMRVLVNGTLIAQGEVVVVNERFGIRVTDIVTPSERIRRIQR